MKTLPLIILGCLLLAGCSAQPSGVEPIEVQMMQNRIIEAQSGAAKFDQVIGDCEAKIENAKEQKLNLHDKAEASRLRLKAYGYADQKAKKETAVFECLREDGLTFYKAIEDEVSNYNYVEDANVFEGVSAARVRKSDGANCYRSEIEQK